MVGFVAGNISNILFHQSPVALSATINLSHTLEAALGAWLVQNIVARPFAFRRLDDVFALISGSAVISTAVGASILAATLTIPPDSVPLREIWYRWLLSDMIGVLVVAPLLLVWLPLTRDSWKITANRAFEAAVLFLALVLLGFLVFFFHPNFARAFILFPILIFVAMRFGLKGATAATTMIALFAIWGTTPRHRNFRDKRIRDNLDSQPALTGILGRRVVDRAAVLDNFRGTSAVRPRRAASLGTAERGAGKDLGRSLRQGSGRAHT